MALAFETGGYGFAPALVPVDQQALQGLKPLSFSGGGQSPVQFQPLAGWGVPSSHPELIAQGVASGLGSIAQGITAAYQSKKEAAQKEKENQQAIALKREEMANQRMIAGMKTSESQDLANLRLEETSRHNQEMEALHQRLIDVGADKHPTAPSIRGGIAPDKQKLQKADSQQEPISSDPNNLIPQDDYYNNLKGVGGSGDLPPPPDPTPLINEAKNPLSQISVPDIEKATIQYNPLNINPDTQYLTTSTGLNPNVPVNPATANPNFPYDLQAIDPRQVVSAAQQFGQQALPVQQQAQALLASLPPVATPVQQTAPVVPQVAPKSEQPEAIPEFDRIIGVPKLMPEQDAIDLRNYAIAKGMIPPDIKPDEYNPNNFRVVWPTTAQQFEFAKNKQAEIDRQQKHADDTEAKFERIKIQNQKAFRTDKPIMNYLASNSPRSMIAPFISAYESAKRFPNAAGAADVSMMDSFGRAESGGRITENQARLIQEAMSLKDQAIAKYGKLYTGQFLTENIRDQMLRELTENVNISADFANKSVSGYMKDMEAGGFPHQKIGLHYFLGGHTPETEFMLKSDAADRIKYNTDQIQKLKEKSKTADPDSANMIRKQIDGLIKQSNIIHKRLEDEADTDSNLLGAKEMRDINHLEGWGGGDVNLIETANP